MKKTLLVTDIPPCSHYTAGIILKQYLKFLDTSKIAIFAVPDRNLHDIALDPDLSHIRYESANRPRENAFRPLPRQFGTLPAIFFERYNEHVAVPRLAKQIARFARDFGAEAIWCVLQGQTMFRLANLLKADLGLPLYTNVWDPPEWWMRSNRIPGHNSKRILKNFDDAIRGSRVCGTAGYDMAEEYHRIYGTKTIPQLPCMPASEIRRPEPKLASNDRLVISFAGQIYASQEWNALLAALNSVGWRLHDRDVVVRVMGRGFVYHTSAACNIEYLGWRSQEETSEWLAKSDINYCPYWFSPEFKTESRLSFPGKLTHYLVCGKPIFFHGPDYASPGKFLTRYKAAAICNSLETAEILKALSKLVQEPEYYRQIVENGFKAFQENLDESHLQKRLRQFLELG